MSMAFPKLACTLAEEMVWMLDGLVKILCLRYPSWITFIG